MLIREVLRQALRTLLAHRLRAALTLFGFVWGTASVIFLVAWGDGVRVMFERGFSRSGRNMGAIVAGRIGEDFTAAADRRWLWLTSDDVEVVRRRARLPVLVGAETQDFKLASYRGRALTTDVRGLDPESQAIRAGRLASGRGISRTDLEHRRRVAVLGDRLRRKLLGAHGGLGSWIRVAGTPFQVVGLLDPVGVQLQRDGLEIDDQIWVPLSTFQVYWPRWWTDEPYVKKILYRVRDRQMYDATRDEMRAIVADRLGVSRSDDQAVFAWSPIDGMRKIPIDQTRGLMAIISLTTLVIGGVGVLSMMLDSVHERRQEIGVRLAVGGRRRDVLVQFFLETFCVAGLGGLLGVGLGVGASLGLGAIDAPDLVPLPVLSGRIIALAVGVMVAIALCAGLWPAWRATRVDPAVTLRME
ncbi:MAG: ABC transporter permease [Myxococcota bacterium]